MSNLKLRTWVNNNPKEDTEKFGHTFDKKKIFLKKAGEKFNVYDRIQAANVDVDIYETLEKYGMVATRENAAQFLESRGEQVYGEVFNAEHPQEIIDRANETWASLPLDVRAQFGHDRKRFAREGEQWLKNNLKKFVEEEQQIKQEKIQQQNITEEGKNE